MRLLWNTTKNLGRFVGITFSLISLGYFTLNHIIGVNYPVILTFTYFGFLLISGIAAVGIVAGTLVALGILYNAIME